MAMDYEIARQVAVIESGGRVIQETRLYNAETGETVGMRSKEHAHDYRYFPEPDLVPLRIERGVAEAGSRDDAGTAGGAARALHRSLWAARIRRARAHASRAQLSEYFEKAASACSGDPRVGGELGDGRSRGAAEGGRQRDRGIAGERGKSGRAGRR